MATSEESIDFAHVSFTKKELGLGLGEEIHEIREYKNGLSFSRLFSDVNQSLQNNRNNERLHI